MTGKACILDPEQRRLVEDTIHAHSVLRNWRLHAVNCRTNHLHIVVSAFGYKPETVRSQFKAWCTRRLKELERKRAELQADPESIRDQWWAERGSQRWINDHQSLERAVLYVAESQDRSRASM
jgi:REP element-mobilizing transposase RayT